MLLLPVFILVVIFRPKSKKNIDLNEIDTPREKRAFEVASRIANAFGVAKGNRRWYEEEDLAIELYNNNLDIIPMVKDYYSRITTKRDLHADYSAYLSPSQYQKLKLS